MVANTNLVDVHATLVQSRVLSYLTQLAIITPYAQFDLRFICQASASKNFNLRFVSHGLSWRACCKIFCLVRRFTRRSLTMPPPAEEIKHHPSAVNDLLIKQLIDNSPNLSLPKFFTSQLSSIDLPLAKRLVGE